MARQGINTGSAPDAGDGDSLLIGALKINENFSEIYTALGDGTNITNSIGFAATAGIASALIPTVNINTSGTITATAFVGDGSGLTGISGGGGGESYWVSTAAGIHTLSNVGIGTTNPTSALTVQGDISVSGVSTFTNTINLNAGNLNIADAGIIKVGSSDIFEIYRSGGEGQVIKSTSDLLLKQSRLLVNNAANTENMLIANQNGSVELYYDNSKKFETLGAGVTVTGTTFTNQLSVSGVVTATTFVGDGSGLTGVVGSGSGVVILDDGSTVGTAGTIDFGTNLSVSPISAGVVTVTASGGIAGIDTVGTSYFNQLTVSGVSTFSDTVYVGSDFTITRGASTTTLNSSTAAGTLRVANNTYGGRLQLRGETVSIETANGGDKILVGSSGAGVTAYYGGYEKFETIGAGVTVTGTTFTNQLSVSGVVTATSFSGSNTLKERTILTGVTTSITNNGIGNINVTGFKSYALMKVGLSTAGWLRLYTDSTSRANDVSRSVGEDPAPGSGVIAEVVTTGISTTQIISPFVMGGNLDEPGDTTIFASIKNLSGITTSISVDLTLLQLEA